MPGATLAAVAGTRAASVGDEGVRAASTPRVEGPAARRCAGPGRRTRRRTRQRRGSTVGDVGAAHLDAGRRGPARSALARATAAVAGVLVHAQRRASPARRQREQVAADAAAEVGHPAYVGRREARRPVVGHDLRRVACSSPAGVQSRPVGLGPKPAGARWRSRTCVTPPPRARVDALGAQPGQHGEVVGRPVRRRGPSSSVGRGREASGSTSSGVTPEPATPADAGRLALELTEC